MTECNCDYYKLTPEEKEKLDQCFESLPKIDEENKEFTDEMKANSMIIDSLLKKQQIYKDSTTGHGLGCPVDVAAVCPNPGDFYMNCGTWSARVIIKPRSNGMLEEGDRIDDKLSISQKHLIENKEETISTRVLGLYRKQ